MEGKVMHMGATKQYIRQAIARDGAADVLVDWTGTDAEALEALAADPREVFCSCDCKKNPDGSCAGWR